MNLRSLAARNVWRNRGRYLAYLISAAFSVMIYFLYTSLAHHPYFQSGYRGAGYVIQGIKAASVVIAIFTLLFLLYSGAAFVRSRMKEFGLLSLLGLSRGQLVRMIVWENLMIGGSAIGMGLGLGLLFLKLFFMAISLLLRLPEALPLYTAWPVWRQTLLVFGSSFLLVSLLSLRGVLRRNIIELIRADRQPKANPRFSRWKAFLGLLLVGGGYAWASVPHPLVVTLGVLPVTVMVSVGTYFVVREGSIAALGWLHRRERFFYRPHPFLTVSQLAFKIQDNYRVLSAVAILVAVILSAVGTIFAFYVVVENDARVSNPQAIQLVLPPGHDVDQEVAKVRATLDEHGVDYLTEHVIQLPSAKLGEIEVALLPYALYANLHRPEGEPLPTPDEQQGIRVPTWSSAGSSNTLPFQSTLQSDGGATELAVLMDYGGKLFNGFDVGYESLVLADAAFARWVADNPTAEYTPIAVWTGENWQGKGMREAITALHALYPTVDEIEVRLTSTLEAYQALVSDFGIALFIGVFVSLVFFAASCSLLYFRLFTEVDEDRRYYTRLQHLGLGYKELRRLAMAQALVVFFVPFLVGLVHSTFAMHALGTLIMRTVLHYGWMVALGYLVPYAVYFLATYGLYWRTLRLGTNTADL